MKTTVSSILFCLLSIAMQTKAESTGRISYYPTVIGREIPNASKELLLSKMEQALAQNGFGSMAQADRFVMVAKCHTLQKDVVPTTPPRISQMVEITFILGDAIENKIYSTASMELKGIGLNETKAWHTAISRIAPKSEAFTTAFSKASSKIEEYYAANCEAILTAASSLAQQGCYDEAIAKAMGIPDVCTSCYEKACQAGADIYHQKISHEAAELLRNAKTIWAAGHDNESASKALQQLAMINPMADIYDAAMKFGSEISATISADKEREWQFKVKQYEDRQKMREKVYADNLQLRKEEQDIRKTELANTHELKMATIAACRSIGENWAKNQPKNNMYQTW